MQVNETPSDKDDAGKSKLAFTPDELPRLNHEVLFLHKYSDLITARNENSDYSLLSAAAGLRHLLLGGLLSKANSRRKLDLTFGLPEEVPQDDAFTSEGFVYWERSFAGEPRYVFLADLLDADCLVIGESGLSAERFSVRDVIKLCANVLGGVHHEMRPQSERKTKLAWLYYGGNSMFRMISAKHTLLLQLEKILAVALEGIEPLEHVLSNDRPDWRGSKIIIN